MATVEVHEKLREEIDDGDSKTRKLFEKQKKFMELNPYYPSLGRRKLENVYDRYGNNLWEIRLDLHRRIVFIEKNEYTFIWLKICRHDEIKRKNVIAIDEY